MYMWGESLVLIMIMISKLINRVFVHSGPIASLLINVFNCRLTMIIGGIFIFIGCALTYFAHSLNVALITYGIIAGKRFFPPNLLCRNEMRSIHVYSCTLINRKSTKGNFVNIYNLCSSSPAWIRIFKLQSFKSLMALNTADCVDIDQSCFYLYFTFKLV